MPRECLRKTSHLRNLSLKDHSPAEKCTFRLEPPLSSLPSSDTFHTTSRCTAGILSTTSSAESRSLTAERSLILLDSDPCPVNHWISDGSAEGHNSWIKVKEIGIKCLTVCRLALRVSAHIGRHTKLLSRLLIELHFARCILSVLTGYTISDLPRPVDPSPTKANTQVSIVGRCGGANRISSLPDLLESAHLRTVRRKWRISER